MKTCLFLIAAILIMNAGCKKDKNMEPVCRIIRLITPDGKQIKIAYNAEGKCAKIENTRTDETTTAVYSSDAIVLTSVTTGTTVVKRRTIYLLNTAGMIYDARHEYYNSSGETVMSAIKNKYEYNGTQVIKATVIDSAFSNPPVVSTNIVDYTWTEGNLTKLNSLTYTLLYEYYTDQPILQGDIQTVNALIAGFDATILRRNKNLTKSEGFSSITYDFDAEGKIKSISQNGNVIYLIEYECN